MLASSCYASSGEKGGVGGRSGGSVRNGFISILDKVDVMSSTGMALCSDDITTNKVNDDDNEKSNDYNGKRRLQTTSAAPNWVQRGGATNGTSDFNKFGAALSLSATGSVLVIGAPYLNGAGAGLTMELFKYMSTLMATCINLVVLPLMVLKWAIQMDGHHQLMVRYWQLVLPSQVEKSTSRSIRTMARSIMKLSLFL